MFQILRCLYLQRNISNNGANKCLVNVCEQRSSCFLKQVFTVFHVKYSDYKTKDFLIYIYITIDKICVLDWWKCSDICVALHGCTLVSATPPWLCSDLEVLRRSDDPSQKGSEDKWKRFTNLRVIWTENHHERTTRSHQLIFSPLSLRRLRNYFCRTSTKAIPKQFRGLMPNGR